MGDFAIEDSAIYEVEGKVAASTTGTTITAGAIDTKGAYSQLVAATGFMASGFYVNVVDNSAVFSRLLDIAIGAAGSEVIIVPDIFGVYLLANAPSYQGMFFPISMNSGVRIAARIAASTASVTLAVTVHIVARGFMPAPYLSRATTYGTAVTGSRGTQVDPGTVAHTKGSFAQLTASTTNPIRMLAMVAAPKTAAAAAGQRWLVDIAVGAAAAEQIVIPDVPVDEISTRGIGNGYILFPVSIPAGTRLSARAQSTDITATERILDVTLIGFD